MMDIDFYLRGTELYGDDFGSDQIRQWYEDEEEGYASLGAKDLGEYKYGYHAWNWWHVFRFLRERRFASALGFGSAWADEFLPISGQVEKLVVVDPSTAFVRSEVHGIPTTYVKPTPEGVLPYEGDVFDLVTCFGALHHIPNVSFVVNEIGRTTRAGGILCLREPIVSMGDWRRPRRGLTKRERGIPIHLLETIVENAGFRILRRSYCGFPTTPRLFKYLPGGAFNSPFATRVDALFSRVFAWNISYHPQSLFAKLRPTSAFLLAERVAD